MFKTVFGPRQSGKTTLVRMAFPDKPYRSLEDPDIRRIAREDPRGFFEGLPDGAILDEVETSEQLKRYRHTFPNAILTDFYEFRLYRDGQRLARVVAGQSLVPGTLKAPLPRAMPKAWPTCSASSSPSPSRAGSPPARWRSSWRSARASCATRSWRWNCASRRSRARAIFSAFTALSRIT